VTPPRSTGVQQHYTHRKLVGPATPQMPASRTPALDAIIVPASRHATNLDHAITLARVMKCHLVLLCSRDARTSQVNHLLASRSFAQASVIELPSQYRHDLLEFTTSQPELQPLEPCAARDTDLSMKRNVGLALARMLRWNRIFFLDDDIRDFESAALRHTVSMLGRYSSVGMRVTSFPDNSVMCHAHRATGGLQDVLVSGSALAVDCTGPLGFFPDVYNEDWFFFYNYATKGSLGCSGRHATQLAYDPFADPLRAARQEFGDVLAEGLYALLHYDTSRNASREYWVHFLDARREFLAAIIARIEHAQPEMRSKIRRAVKRAQRCLAQIQPELCESYVAAWRKDVWMWNERLEQMPEVFSIDDALSQLNLKADEGNAKAALTTAMPPDKQDRASSIQGAGTPDGGWATTDPVPGPEAVPEAAGGVFPV
jgi:hypothetical protein